MTDRRPRSGHRWQPETLLPVAVRPGTEPWRWAAISVRSVRGAVALSWAVIGTGLVGMGISLMLHGLGVLTLEVSQPEPETLVVGLALTMIAGAVLGLATEVGFRAPSYRPDAAPWETVATWVPALLIALWTTERLEGLAERLLPGFSDLFNLAVFYLNEVGREGLLAGLAGLPLIWLALQFGPPRYPMIKENAPALLYTCWTALVIFGYPVSAI